MITASRSMLDRPLTEPAVRTRMLCAM